MAEGYFITFEGIDGIGKTTHITQLRRYLVDNDHSVFIYREPGGTKFGEGLRAVLKDSTVSRTSIAELLAFNAARHVGVEQIVRPALENGQVVLADRFDDSTVVYQGICGGLDLEVVNSVINIATNGLKPNLTFLIDADPSIAIRGGGDHFEDRGKGYQEELRKGFLDLAKDEPERFRIIPYRKDEFEEMQEEIRGIVAELIGLQKIV